MKYINLKKIGLIVFLMILFAIPSSVSANSGDITGSGASGQGTGAQECTGCSVWMDWGREWGYRVAIYDSTSGEYLGKSNILRWNYGSGDFYMAAGNRMRKEYLNGPKDYSNIVPSSSVNYITSSAFIGQLVNFTRMGTKSNFTDVLKTTLNLVGAGGSYTMIDPNTGIKAEEGVIISMFNNFFSQVGLPNIGQSIVDRAKLEHELYLEVEPMMAWEIRSSANGEASLKGKRLVLTATESAYYILQNITNSGQISIVLGKLTNAQYIDSSEMAVGDGFYGTTLPLSFSCKAGTANYINYCSSILSELNGTTRAGELYSGAGVGIWRLTDIVTGCKKCCTPEEQASNPECSFTHIESGCPYKIESNNPSTCNLNGAIGSGYIRDKASWECVFQSTTEDKRTEVQAHYVKTNSNAYCTIYCKEEVNTYLPTYGAYTDLGSYLTITSGVSSYKSIGPITIIGTTTCRTSSTSVAGKIDFEKFKTDYASKDALVVAAWNNLENQARYMEALHRLNSNTNVSTSSSGGTCSEHTEYSYVTCTDGNGSIHSCVNTPWFTERQTINAPSCSASYRGAARACYSHEETKRVVDSDHTLTTVTSTYKGATVTKVDSSCGKHSRGADYSESTYNAALQAYNTAVANRQAVLNALLQCNNFVYNYNELNPEITISYSDSIYNGEYPLSVQSSYSPLATINYYTEGTSYDESPSGGTIKSYSVGNSGNFTYYYDINGSTTNISVHICPSSSTYSDVLDKNCNTVSSITVPNNSWVEEKTTKAYTYKLNDNLYNYIIKESGQSINYEPTTNIKNYTYLPFGNLPVHFSSPVNTDISYSINIKSLGVNDKFTQYVFNGKSFNGNSVSMMSNYACWYHVNEDVYVVRGTNIIYRTISLRDPFPGETGTTRDPGYNWRGDALETNYPEKYIHNNRGVTEYEVYNLDPMYEIDLTPAMMRKIQAYNAEQSNKTGSFYGKTSILGYSDFTLTCKQNGSYKNSECTSKILRDEWGVTGCAIKDANLSGYSNCGKQTVAW